MEITCAADASFSCAAFSCAALPSALGCPAQGKAVEPGLPVEKPPGAAAAPAEVMLLRPKPELVDGAKPDAAAPGAMLPRKPSRPTHTGGAQSSTRRCRMHLKFTAGDYAQAWQPMGGRISAQHISRADRMHLPLLPCTLIHINCITGYMQ